MQVGPGLRLVCVLTLGFTALIAAVETARRQPRVDQVLSPGMQVSSAHGQLIIEPLDLVPEPGEIAVDDDLRRFYSRQGELAKILKAPLVTVQAQDATVETAPHGIGVLDLPAIFWIQIIVGLGAIAVSGWVWVLRPGDLASGLFALSGLSTLAFTASAAVYTTRELALNASLFRGLVAVNAAGASLFGISMLALFLVYPIRLHGWRIWASCSAAAFGVVTLLSILGFLPAAFGVNLITLVEMIGICLAIGAQFVATRRAPEARAALTWLGLSVLIGAGAFIALNALPLAIGADATMLQGYAFLFFLVIYVGLAFGLRRYRLFDVGRWAYRFLFYAAGAVLFALVDAVLVISLGMERIPALGLAVAAIALVYLPLRDAIWRRFDRRRVLAPHQLLADALHVAFAETLAEGARRWEQLLKRLFDPLEMAPVDHPVSRATLAADGLTMIVPAVAKASALKMSHPWGGRALFSPDSCALVQELGTLIGQAVSSREAYDRGVTEERRRMTQDLHDDIGARLLTGLHMADEKMRPTFQAALADIRAIVGEMSGEKVTVAQLLADVRFEAEQRLTASGLQLDWPLDDAWETWTQLLDYRQHKAIRSACRELVSNVIRHAGATRVKVSVSSKADALHLSFSDDGRGMPRALLEGESKGYGLGSLRRRLSALGGRFGMDSSASGTRVELTLPYGITLPP